jgi:hypothetical protein
MMGTGFLLPASPLQASTSEDTLKFSKNPRGATQIACKSRTGAEGFFEHLDVDRIGCRPFDQPHRIAGFS